MKVKICYTIEVSDEIRRAINHHYGLDGLATREQVQNWYRSNGSQADDDLLYDLEHSEQEDEE